MASCRDGSSRYQSKAAPSKRKLKVLRKRSGGMFPAASFEWCKLNSSFFSQKAPGDLPLLENLPDTSNFKGVEGVMLVSIVDSSGERILASCFRYTEGEASLEGGESQWFSNCAISLVQGLGVLRGVLASILRVSGGPTGLSSTLVKGVWFSSF